MEAFDIAFTDVYGETPLSKDTLQHLDAAYVERAEKDVALQLSRAGIRLAAVHNKALGRQVADKRPREVQPSIPPTTSPLRGSVTRTAKFRRSSVPLFFLL
jgi:hypothetical protein